MVQTKTERHIRGGRVGCYYLLDHYQTFKDCSWWRHIYGSCSKEGKNSLLLEIEVDKINQFGANYQCAGLLKTADNKQPTGELEI